MGRRADPPAGGFVKGRTSNEEGSHSLSRRRKDDTQPHSARGREIGTATVPPGLPPAQELEHDTTTEGRGRITQQRRCENA